MNVEYLINKEIHNIINIWLKTTYIILKILIKQNVLFQMPNKHIDDLTLTTYGVDIEIVNQFYILGFTLISHLNTSKHIDKIANGCS